MSRLIRAELLKARASRTTWVLAAIAPLFCALWAVLPFTFDGPLRAETVYGMAQQAYVFTLILGVLGMAGEHRHQTITWAFLVTPRRGAVVAAKLVAYAVVGLLIAVVSALVTSLTAAALLAMDGHAVLTPGVPAVLAGSVASTTLYAVFGVALGALIRNQVAAVAVALVWFMYGDYMLAWLAPDVVKWLPAGAARAAAGLRVESGALLPAWGGGLLFAAYVAAIVLAARLITLRRDVT